MICNTVREDSASLDKFLTEGQKSLVSEWLRDQKLQPAELTNIIVAYKSRADFVPNSLIHEFESTVLKISPHLTGPQAVSLLLKMSDT